MKKEHSKPLDDADDEMLPEYDFSGGTRGKHYKAYRQGHTVTIHKMDGTIVVQHFTLEDNAVILDPDVRKYFPNAEAVNNALRMLITLIPQKSRRQKRHRKASSDIKQ